MKSILVADNRPELLATLEPILKHWGYRVLSTHRASQVKTFLRESQPCMLIIGEGLLSAKDLALDNEIKIRIEKGAFPCIALRQEQTQNPAIIPQEIIEVPLELFELFSFIQRKVEKHPRQNLRLRLKIPGMFSTNEEEFILADVISLSMEGLFFKSPRKMQAGERLTVVFPLIGQCQEIEVQAKVLYTIEPDIRNNFFQGFGVGFDQLVEEQREQLMKFIRELFLKEVSSRNDGVGDFAETQLKN